MEREDCLSSLDINELIESFNLDDFPHQEDCPLGPIFDMPALPDTNMILVCGAQEQVNETAMVMEEDDGNPNEYDIAFLPDEDGDTDLHIAIIMEETKRAKELIYMSTRDVISLKNNNHQTPLHLAVMTNNKRLIRPLILAGADLKARDSNGNTPLHIACTRDYNEIAIQLTTPVTELEKQSQCMRDMAYKDGSIPQDLSILNYDGYSCLHLCVLHERVRPLFCLLQIKTQRHEAINLPDGKHGKTALHYACEMGYKRVAKLLVACQECDLDAKTYDDQTPFQLARSRDNHSTALVLAQEYCKRTGVWASARKS